MLEHVSTFKERKTMLERIGMLLRPRFAPWFVFIAAFVPVFLLMVATTTLITFIMPESYSSTVRIKPAWTMNDRAGQLEFESIQSEAVLGKVIDALDLNQAWGKKYAGGSSLKTYEALPLLKARLDLRPVRGADLIEIRVFSDDRDEAAKLANAIADTYREDRSSAFSVEIVDKAAPGLRPVRPNKPLNIALGILGGMLLALAAGAGMAGVAAWIGRRSRGPGAPPTTGAAPPPDLPHANGRPAKSGLDKLTGILWMGIGGALFGLALVALVWFLIFQQVSVTAELLLLPVFGLCWGSNAVLGFFLSRGKRWARISLGVEGVLFLTYYYFKYGFPLPHCPAWASIIIIRLGSFIFGAVPYISRWVFIALALVSICALLWPRKETAANVG
jgi:capsular polysaccharide biosynthesis protein